MLLFSNNMMTMCYENNKVVFIAHNCDTVSWVKELNEEYRNYEVDKEYAIKLACLYWLQERATL